MSGQETPTTSRKSQLERDGKRSKDRPSTSSSSKQVIEVITLDDEEEPPQTPTVRRTPKGSLNTIDNYFSKNVSFEKPRGPKLKKFADLNGLGHFRDVTDKLVEEQEEKSKKADYEEEMLETINSMEEILDEHEDEFEEHVFGFKKEKEVVTERNPKRKNEKNEDVERKKSRNEEQVESDQSFVSIGADEPEPEVEALMEPEVQMEAEPVVENEPEPEVQAEKHPEVPMEPEPEPELQMEPEPEPEVQKEWEPAPTKVSVPTALEVIAEEPEEFVPFTTKLTRIADSGFPIDHSTQIMEKALPLLNAMRPPERAEYTGHGRHAKADARARIAQTSAGLLRSARAERRSVPKAAPRKSTTRSSSMPAEDAPGSSSQLNNPHSDSRSTRRQNPTTSDAPSTSNAPRFRRLTTRKQYMAISNPSLATGKKEVYDFERKSPSDESQENGVVIALIDKEVEVSDDDSDLTEEEKAGKEAFIAEIEKNLPNTGNFSTDLIEFYQDKKEKLDKCVRLFEKSQDNSDMLPNNLTEHWRTDPMTMQEHKERVTYWDYAVMIAVRDRIGDEIKQLKENSFVLEPNDVRRAVELKEIMDFIMKELEDEFSIKHVTLRDVAEKKDEMMGDTPFFQKAIHKLLTTGKRKPKEGAVLYCMTANMRKAPLIRILDKCEVNVKDFFAELERVVEDDYVLPKGKLYRRLLLNVLRNFFFNGAYWECISWADQDPLEGIPFSKIGFPLV